jgi:hypothetical protein
MLIISRALAMAGVSRYLMARYFMLEKFRFHTLMKVSNAAGSC